MTPSLRAGLLSLAVLAAPLPALAEEFSAAQRAEIIGVLRDALKQDPSILRDAVAALQADESAREQAAQKSAIASMKDRLVQPTDPVGGNPKGDVTIVEFFDVRCGYCKRMEPGMAQFLGEDRKVRVVYKDLPILGPASVLG